MLKMSCWEKLIRSIFKTMPPPPLKHSLSKAPTLRMAGLVVGGLTNRHVGFYRTPHSDFR